MPQVENIMLDARGHVKLIDFGLAVEVRLDDESVSPTGSLIYMAPEMIRDHSGGRHTDWYQLLQLERAPFSLWFVL
jgi:serine/threonine protein kinase